MKKGVGILVCLVPLAAFGQQTYTNEDLKKFSVPGAYTNQDLKKMPPLPVVKGVPVAPVPVRPEAPEAQAYQLRLGLLQEQRLMLQTELDWRQEMVRKANSAFDKGTDGHPWPGFLSKNKGSILYLEMQLTIVDARIEHLRDEASRAGVILEIR